MTHLEKLNARYEEIQDLLQINSTAGDEIHDAGREKQQAVLEKYFTAEEGDIVECSYSSISVRRASSPDRWSSFLDMYVEDQWNSDGRVYTNFYISNSSFRTSEIEEWVAERFASQAHYSRIAIDFKDDILAELNQIVAETRKMYKEVHATTGELKEESKKLREEIESIERQARVEALSSKEGLVIKGREVESYWKKGEFRTEFPDLKVKFDCTIRSVRGLRIDKMSASGKSADITVMVKRDQWTQDGSVLRDQIVEEQIERVRMENIEAFLRQNSIAI